MHDCYSFLFVFSFLRWRQTTSMTTKNTMKNNGIFWFYRRVTAEKRDTAYRRKTTAIEYYRQTLTAIFWCSRLHQSRFRQKGRNRLPPILTLPRCGITALPAPANKVVTDVRLGLGFRQSGDDRTLENVPCSIIRSGSRFSERQLHFERHDIAP